MSFTQEQLEKRRGGIGASEIGAIAGLNPYSSALDVYMEKVGLKESFEGNERTEWGNTLEPVIAQKFFDRWGKAAGVKDMIEVETLYHPESDFFFATPDRLLMMEDGSLCGLEIKNVGQGAKKFWGQQGSDNIPEWYLTQVVWQMWITSLNYPEMAVNKWFVAALVTGNEFRVYEVEWNDDLIDKLSDLAMAFWKENVEKRLPPTETAPPEALKRYVSSVFQYHDEDFADTSDAFEGWIEALVALKGEREEISRQIGEIEATIKGYIGENLGVRGNFGTVTWKRSKDRAAVDYKSLIESALSSGKISEEDIREFTTTKPGSRRFYLALKTEDNNEQ